MAASNVTGKERGSNLQTRRESSVRTLCSARTLRAAQREERHVRPKQRQAENLTALQSIRTAGSGRRCGDLGNSENEELRTGKEEVGCAPNQITCESSGSPMHNRKEDMRSPHSPPGPSEKPPQRLSAQEQGLCHSSLCPPGLLVEDLDQ